jgi:hypothetical protein
MYTFSFSLKFSLPTALTLSLSLSQFSSMPRKSLVGIILSTMFVRSLSKYQSGWDMIDGGDDDVLQGRLSMSSSSFERLTPPIYQQCRCISQIQINIIKPMYSGFLEFLVDDVVIVVGGDGDGGGDGRRG